MTITGGTEKPPAKAKQDFMKIMEPLLMKKVKIATKYNEKERVVLHKGDTLKFLKAVPKQCPSKAKTEESRGRYFLTLTLERISI